MHFWKLLALLLAALSFSQPALAQGRPGAVATPNLGAHGALGAAVSAAQIELNSSSAPAEGRDVAILDSSLDSFVRHQSEVVTFSFRFKSPVALRALRFYSDTVDKASVALFSGQTQLGAIDVSQPYENISRNGQEGEFYVVRYNGSAPVDRVEIVMDYYSDADAARHRFYFADFLARSLTPSVQLQSGESIEGQLQGQLRFSTIRGQLQTPAERVASIVRTEGMYEVRLVDGSHFRALPADAELELRGASVRKVLWAQIASVQGNATPAPAAPQALYLSASDGALFIGQIVSIQGRALAADSLEPLRLEPGKIESLRPGSASPALNAQVGGYGAVLFSANSSIEFKCGAQTFTFALGEIQQIVREAPPSEGGAVLENQARTP
ncbi:MAG: hypothetical protein K1X75_06270 [Leptospirales bacterium]|nr:hypothetical protein [Leptospirales bacterium]